MAPPPLPCGRLVVVATVVRTGGVSTLRGRFACGWVSVRLALRASLVVSLASRRLLAIQRVGCFGPAAI